MPGPNANHRAGDDRSDAVLWDLARVVDLEDGYRLGWLVDGEGIAWPFVRVPGAEDCSVPWGPGIDDLAEHEGTGRLPVALRDRLGLVARCGAVTVAGRPCRARVAARGDRCSAHAGQPVHPDAAGEQLSLLTERAGRST